MKKQPFKIALEASLIFFLIPSMAFAATTWNPADKSTNITLTNGNLTATGDSSTSWLGVRSTDSKSTGKYYFEITINAMGQWGSHIGLSDSSCPLSGNQGSNSHCWFIDTDDGKVYPGGTSYGSHYSNGDILRLAVDLNTHKMWFGKNASWFGDPVAETGEAFSNLSGSLYLETSLATNTSPPGQSTANFGSTSFGFEMPSGYSSFDGENELPPEEGTTTPTTYNFSTTTYLINNPTQDAFNGIILFIIGMIIPIWIFKKRV